MNAGLEEPRRIVAERSSGWAERRHKEARRIEKAALGLMLKRSADEVSIDELADAAGISRRTFFRYFSSRDDLLIALPARVLFRSMARVRSRPAEESVLEAIVAVARDSTISRDDAELMRLSVQVMTNSPIAWARAVGRLRQDADEAYVDAVAFRKRQMGEDDADAPIIGVTISALVAQIYADWAENGCNGPLAENIEAGFRTMGGVFSPPPATSVLKPA